MKVLKVLFIMYLNLEKNKKKHLDLLKRNIKKLVKNKEYKEKLKYITFLINIFYEKQNGPI